jgi:hypothetical protein
MAYEMLYAAAKECGALRAPAPEVWLMGNALSPGIGLGHPCFYHAVKLAGSATRVLRADESERLREALDRVRG